MITICMPFYNAQNTIRQTIISILNQSYSNFKVILLDDGSTDGSLETIGDLLDSRFQVIRNEKNRGLIFSLNHIASICETKYIARMDSDDIMHPNRLEYQLSFLESNQNIDVVDTLMLAFSDSFEITGLVKFNYLETIEHKNTIFSTPLSHATIMAKTYWYKNNPYDSNFYRAEDHELFCRTFENSNFARLYVPLYFVRSHSINIRNYKSALKTQIKIINKYKFKLKSFEYFFSLLKIRLKATLYTLFGLFNSQHLLVSQRNHKLSHKSYQHYSKILKKSILTDHYVL